METFSKKIGNEELRINANEVTLYTNGQVRKLFSRRCFPKLSEYMATFSLLVVVALTIANGDYEAAEDEMDRWVCEELAPAAMNGAFDTPEVSALRMAEQN